MSTSTLAPVRIAVLGANGKMGRAIVRVVAGTPGGALGAAVERADSPAVGQDAGVLAGGAALGVAVQGAAPAAGAADVWIDFSVPAATVAAARAGAAAGAALVIGTTGLGAAERAELEAAARRVPIVFAPNMSVGVNVLLKLVADAARALGPSYDIDVVEAHHRAKRDAPSGTALRLAEAAAEGAGRDLAAVARYARHGEIGARPRGEIGIQTLRGGDVVGDHTVFFFGDGERIEITHRASSRDTFAQGAVRAALWVAGRPPGLYDMRAVLGT
ncbi:MAG: 4-hydroxy-tetrahydrodipicolinate reductase [Phenylobacterium sp.]|uniref:4-hydroxy-tetrahydrodipicolinate reductase n=1 Tax=Phenylobacterium sp. TaxID=1871053 RepID=UPI001208A1A2|nr:4-hydroxy-tetrahydrodipicolinate reductase [Phenylobacterium sp.]TAL29008.1 MAG: 4-hydroxy-tetrahydrodipicolinate reductase [Phenylobacterium sp.]